MGLFDQLGFQQSDPNNPFQQQTPGTAELIFRLAQNLGPLAHYIGGTRTPLGRTLGAGSVLAGGLSGTAADLLQQQRVDPIKQKMAMAQAAINMGNQAAVPKIDLANSQFAVPDQGQGFAPAPMAPGQGGFAPKMPTSPFGNVTAQQLVAASAVPGLAPFIDPNKELQRQVWERTLREPFKRDIHTELRDPNDPTKIIAAAGLTQAEQEKKAQDDLAQQFNKDAQELQKRNPTMTQREALATTLEDPNKNYGTLPDTYAGPKLAREWRRDQFSTEKAKQAQDFAYEKQAEAARIAQAREDARHNRALQEQYNPVIPQRDAGLWVDGRGNSLDNKLVVGKRFNDLPAGANRLNNAQEVNQVKAAKEVVGIGERLRTLAPTILKQYGKRSLGQLFTVQGNRIALKSDALQGDPNLKRFTTLLNDYSVNLPQAQGIPGGRESNALIQRFSSGAPALGDTVQSLEASIDENMNSLNLRWGSRNVDLTPENYVRPPTAPPTGIRMPTPSEVNDAKKLLGLR